MNGILNTMPNRKIGSFGDSGDYINKTVYYLDFWKSAYMERRVRSMLKNGTLFGELGHPNGKYRDRDIDLEKISHRIRNLRFVGQDGTQLAHIDDFGTWIDDADYDHKQSQGDIVADVDILDTPNGKILNTFYTSGANVGFSTRADGDSYTGKSGSRIPDVNTYKMYGTDIVLNPSKTDARILDEGVEEFDEGVLETHIIELLNNSTPNDRAIMEDYLKNSDFESLKSNYFGDMINIRKTELDEIKSEILSLKKENKKLEDLYLKYLGDNEVAENVAELILNIAENFENKFSNKNIGKDDIRTQAYDTEYSELIEENEELMKKVDELEDELAETKEKLNNTSDVKAKNYLAYIVKRDFPNAKNQLKLMEAINNAAEEQPITYKLLQSIYNGITFSSPLNVGVVMPNTLGVLSQSSEILLDESESTRIVSKDKRTERLRKLLGSKK